MRIIFKARDHSKMQVAMPTVGIVYGLCCCTCLVQFRGKLGIDQLQEKVPDGTDLPPTCHLYTAEAQWCNQTQVNLEQREETTNKLHLRTEQRTVTSHKTRKEKRAARLPIGLEWEGTSRSISTLH